MRLYTYRDVPQPEDVVPAILWECCNTCGYVFRMRGTVVDGADVLAHKEHCVPPFSMGTSLRQDSNYCVNGHEYTPENLFIRSSGSKVCKICRREATARWYKKHANK